MSEPGVKLQVSLDNPNIESNVPGEQKLRTSEIVQTNLAKSVDESTNENTTASDSGEKSETMSSKQNAAEDATELAAKEDFVLTPVITVTKEEAVFTKGDLKLQKISVTEDISGAKTVTRMSREHKIVIDNGDPDIHDEVFTVQQVRIDRGPSEQAHKIDRIETKKNKTRIPTLRFRQAVDKLRKERRSYQDNKEPETPQPTSRKSSIPRLIDSRIPSLQTFNKSEKNETTPQCDDEFDKLYDEIVDDQDSDDNLSIASKIEDPIKLENTFEELIHAYDDNKVQQPVNAEKVKQSKIPLLKRKSEQEIDVPKQIVSVTKQSTSLDESTVKISESILEKHDSITSATLNKSPIRTTFVSKIVSQSESVHESTADTSESFATVNVMNLKENNNNLVTRSVKAKDSIEFTDNVQVGSETKSFCETSSKTVTSRTINFNNIKTNEETTITGHIKDDVFKDDFNEKSKIVNDTKSGHKSSSEAFKSFRTYNAATFKENTNTKVIKDNKDVSTAEFVDHKKIISETILFKESSVETSENLRTVNVSTLKENENNIVTKNILEETSKIVISDNDRDRDVSSKEPKEFIKVATPIFDNMSTNDLKSDFKSTSKATVQNYKVEELRSVKNVESSNEIEHKTNSIKLKQNETINHATTNKSFEETGKKDIDYLKNKETSLHTEEGDLLNKDEEDIIILRGKVNRIIRRISSIEPEVKPSKKDLGDEIPKNKTVMSKIAMFERPEPAEVLKTKTRCTSQIPRRKTDEFKQPLNNSINTPKIVDEVLKAMPAQIIEDNHNTETKINSPLTGKDQNVLETKLDLTNNGLFFDLHSSTTPPQQFGLKERTNEFGTQISELKPKALAEYIEFAKTDGEFVAKSTKQTNTASVDLVTCNNNFNSHKKGEFLESNSEPKASESFQKIDFTPAFVNLEQIGNTNVNLNEEVILNTKNYILKDIKHNGSDKEDNNKGYSCNEKIKDNKCDFVSIKNGVEINLDVTRKEVQSEEITVTKEKKVENMEEGSIYHKKIRKDEGQLRIHAYRNNEFTKMTKVKSSADLDLGNAVKGKVRSMVGRMSSFERIDLGKKEIIDMKERPRSRSVSEKIALFERKLTPVKIEKHVSRMDIKHIPQNGLCEEELAKKIEELQLAKTKFGRIDQELMKYLELRDGGKIPVLGIGTALLEPKLARYVVQAAIDLGYRTIDTAYIYGNEKEVGEGIREKIRDGTVVREDLFIISKLWSTFHRRDLVEGACRSSLEAMGLDYFDLYLIHNPMSFKEGADPIPKIASVIQFSQHDYLDAWIGMEGLVRRGLVKRAGVSNFNSVQVDRVVEKGKIKPVINQVECHPYLSQHRLDEFCQARGVKLCCFGVLGSRGTPQEFKSNSQVAVDDPLVRVMAAGLGVSPAAMLISYQVSLGRSVVVKASDPAHLWENLAALRFEPGAADVSAIHALNRNKRTFGFKGMGDTHRNYPFNIPF